MTQCEIFIAINEDGDWIVVDDESTALEQLASDRGGYQARVVKVVVNVSPPKMQEATVTIADDISSTVTVEA